MSLHLGPSKMTSELEQYQIQLDQVELALTQDPEDEELLALKKDLLEVISLSQELENDKEHKKVSKAEERKERKLTEKERLLDGFQEGQKVLAPWSKDGHYYHAVIDEMLPGSTTVAITFPEYGEKDICKFEDLLPDEVAEKELQDSKSYSTSIQHARPGGKLESTLRTAGRRDWIEAEKEKRAYKKEKKAAKLKADIEMGEKAKDNWQNFMKSKKKGKKNPKITGKSGMLYATKSIIATSDCPATSIFAQERKMTKSGINASYNSRKKF